MAGGLGRRLGVLHLRFEVDEDRESFGALNAARESADHEARVWLALVIVVLEARAEAVRMGELVLAKNAAYAARRRSRSSVAEEPAAQAVIEEVGAAPDDDWPTRSTARARGIDWQAQASGRQRRPPGTARSSAGGPRGRSVPFSRLAIKASAKPCLRSPTCTHAV